VFQLVADGAVLSFRASLAQAQGAAESLIPQTRDLHVTAIPAQAPGPSRQWYYDYTSRQWVQK
jgi:hypothetical protein